MEQDRIMETPTPPDRRTVLRGAGAAIVLGAAPGVAGLCPPRAFPVARTVVLTFEVPAAAPEQGSYPPPRPHKVMGSPPARDRIG